MPNAAASGSARDGCRRRASPRPTASRSAVRRSATRRPTGDARPDRRRAPSLAPVGDGRYRIRCPPASAALLDAAAAGPRRPVLCSSRYTSRASLPGIPGTASSSSRDAARIASGEPKCFSSARLRAGPTPGQLVEDRGGHRAVATDPVVGDREPVRLVADPLEQLQLGRVVRERAAAPRAPGMNTSSIRFASEITTTPRSRNPCERAQPGRQLALAAVDHDQVRERREARVVVLVVRRDVALALPAREPAAEDLLHRREVVRGRRSPGPPSAPNPRTLNRR